MGGEKAVSLFCGDLRGREYGMKSVVAGEAPPTAEASKTPVKQIISVSVFRVAVFCIFGSEQCHIPHRCAFTLLLVAE